LTALTGGYRRTPVLQIGADIYCDTALICDVLEHIAPRPNTTLYPEAVKGVARIVAQWADSALFTAAMAYNFQPAGVAQVFAGAPAEAVQAFVADRGAMRGGVPRMSSADAAATYKSYLRRLANMLHGQDFLLGTRPCVADFAAYHPLWFTQERTPALAGILDATPEVLAWMARMKAIGHGTFGKLSAAEALQMVSRSTPSPLQADVFQDDHGIPLGTRVVIAAEHFGQEPTEGDLVAATRTRYTLRRTDERAGTLHVHFPRVGFTLKKAAP
jgi:glutathione S-transferase